MVRVQAFTALLTLPVAFGLAVHTAKTISPSIPTTAAPGHQTLDANFLSYSIEFSYMLDYAGNNSHPNKLSKQLLENLHDVSGAYPIIRAGGTTSNRAVFVANQSEALIEKFSSSDSDQPKSLSIGPAWTEAFQQFPKGTKYIYGLNFNDGESGLEQTVLEAAAAYKAIGGDIYAFEIGNEVDGFQCSSRRSCSWTIASYADQFKKYAAAIVNQSLGDGAKHGKEPLFQGCAFQAPRHLGFNETPFWNVENALERGMDSTGMLKTVADHDYMGSACGGATDATIEHNLLNHHHMTSLMYYHEYLGNYTASKGVPYVLGETNSISCQGLANVSDVYAAALWSVDYTLYAASLNISRIYYHMGTPYRYSAWQPVQSDETAAHVKPLYYGNLFAAAALSGGNKQVSVLVNETSLAAYGIYDTKSGSKTSLKSVAIVNLDVWNSTQPAAERPYTAFKLPNHTFSGASVKRLTSPGVEIAGDITFAGQSVDDNGSMVGKQKVETLSHGEVLVGAGEAVLVTLSH
ncbi:hypothetical protein BJY00DRAFT_326196 [Aspergillus carlsbadensis]|nr:hypothetical protein BJY00DRAFT_326196 [Aspergillus carlsbadensis]